MNPPAITNRQLPPPVAYTLLFLVFISTFRVFATLPLDFLHQAVSTFAIVSLTLYYLFSMGVSFSRRRVTRIDIVMWIFILVNFFTAYQGKAVFGQPYYYGIMAQRSVLLSLSGILVISMLNRGMITIAQLERTFVILSFTFLLTCYFFSLFVDPNHFESDEFVAFSSIRGYRYRFQFAVVIMLLFYSLFKISHEGKKHYLSIVLLIMFYLIYFLQSRTTLVVLAITLLIYFYRNFTLKQRVKNTLIYGGLILATVTIFVTLGYTGLFEKYRMLYHNVLDAFVSGTPDEASSAVRYMEFNTALSYINKNPILGNGFISNQWNGGWHDLLGYFYPVDIGILGNIFVFGIAGTLLIYLPYVFSLNMARKIRSNNVFFKTCEYMLLFFFFSMFFSAVNIRDSSSIMFLVCLIYYYRYYYFKEEVVPDKQKFKPALA
jgi:hypothetical protein